MTEEVPLSAKLTRLKQARIKPNGLSSEVSALDSMSVRNFDKKNEITVLARRIFPDDVNYRL